MKNNIAGQKIRSKIEVALYSFVWPICARWGPLHRVSRHEAAINAASQSQSCISVDCSNGKAFAVLTNGGLGVMDVSNNFHISKLYLIFLSLTFWSTVINLFKNSVMFFMYEETCITGWCFGSPIHASAVIFVNEWKDEWMNSTDVASWRLGETSRRV